LKAKSRSEKEKKQIEKEAVKTREHQKRSKNKISIPPIIFTCLLIIAQKRVHRFLIAAVKLQLEPMAMNEAEKQ